MKSKTSHSQVHIYLLTIVRIAVGWHFLYEGIAKLIAGNWSSAAYLAGSKWIFAPFFHWMAGNAGIVAAVDFVNIWGMILVGTGLMLGLFSRWASAGGALMLFFYFIAYPPIPGYMFGVPAEGSYLWVNRNLIEFLVLLALVFLSSEYLFGLDRLYSRWKEEKARKPVADLPSGQNNGLDRREAIRNLISIPAIGAFAYAVYRKKRWDSFEEKLLSVKGMDANSGATLLKFNYST
ncbi:MAG: DoxX family protein, partial [Bacteroidales bacterium]